MGRKSSATSDDGYALRFINHARREPSPARTELDTVDGTCIGCSMADQKMQTLVIMELFRLVQVELLSISINYY